MERRVLGRTGLEVAVVGFGGLLVRDETASETDRLVRVAVDRGVNFFDVAPTYGNAEERLGPALEPMRAQVVLSCKTTQRTAAEAERELAASLRKLRTDWFDLYQIHGVSSLAEAERVLGPGGALEAFVRARERGMIRFIGFSAHSEAAALRLLECYPFESVMFPIHAVGWENAQFGRRIAERAVALGAGLVALKSLARRPLRKRETARWRKCWYEPFDTPETVTHAVAFTLSVPGVATLLTPGHEKLWEMACMAASQRETYRSGFLDGEPLFGDVGS